MPAEASRRVVVAALAANSLVALTKLAAAMGTGSSAMLSEAVHSFVDAGNEILLLYGQYRASRPADAAHPLGHGRELYFWSFVVALSVFAVGSGLSLWEGFSQIRHPEPISNPYVNYAVLAVAFVLDSFSWLTAYRTFRDAKGELGWFAAVEQSKDPPSFIVLFEDTADLIGLAVAFAGNLASTMLGIPVLDGVASIGIGVLLGGVAAVLARESKGLLLGEEADPGLIAAILDLVRRTGGITGAGALFTVQLAPDQVLVALSVDFDDALSAADVEMMVAQLETRIRTAHAQVTTLLIKPQNRAAPEAASAGAA